MKQSQVNLATQAVFLMILKLQGLPAWQQNQQEKTSGLVRVVPNDYLDPSEPHFTRQTRWPDLREALLTQGVTEQFPQTSQSTQVTCTVFSGENYEKPALFTQF
jgi:hypothetical protein